MVLDRYIEAASHPHVVWRFYLETGTRGGGGSGRDPDDGTSRYRHYECNSEEEVDAFLAKNPGWTVTERVGFREWRRRPDLEKGRQTR